MNHLAKSPLEVLGAKINLHTSFSGEAPGSNVNLLIKVFPNKLKAVEVYSVDNVVHRDNYPAIIEYYFHASEELVFQTCYYNYGSCYLIQEFYPDGQIKRTITDNFHHLSNPDGPAIINYNRNGTVGDCLFYYKNTLIGRNLPISGPNCVAEYYNNFKILE